VKNKIIIIGVVVLLVLIGVIFVGSNIIVPRDNLEVDCYDCGKGGWYMTDEKCSAVSNIEDAVICLSESKVALARTNDDLDFIRENVIAGFIVEGKYEMVKSEIENGVHVYGLDDMVTVDDDGNVWAVGLLG